MRHIAVLVCCSLAFGFGQDPVTADSQIPTSRPRTTQAPPPASDAAKPTADPKTKDPGPSRPAGAPAQVQPKDLPAGSTFPELQNQIADAIRQNQLGRALTLAERQRTLYPNEMKASADLANVLMLRGDAARAEPLLRAATTQKNVLYTGSPTALLGDVFTSLGQLALDGNRHADAIAVLLRAVDNAPTATRARYLLAEAFDRSGDSGRASREIRAAFDVDPTSARAADYRLLARTSKAAGNTKAAAAALGDAVRRFPTDVSLRVDYAAALSDAKLSSAALYELLHLRMVLRSGAPQLAEVDRQIERLRAEAEASSPEPDPQLELMFAYLADAEVDQHEEALPAIQDVIALNSGASIVPLILLGRSLKATGRCGEAERVLTQIAERDPESVPALAELADLYYFEGRLETARRVVDRAEKIDPRNPRLLEVVAFWK